MKFDPAQPIYALTREVMEDSSGKPIKMGDIVCQHISVLPTDANVPGSEKKKRFMLSVKMYQAEEPIEIDEADVSLINGVIDKTGLPPLVSEQIKMVLEGKANPLAPKQDLKLVAGE